MRNTGEILKALADRGIKQKEIAEALGLPQPRISELYNGKRNLKYEEGRKLIDAFDLDEESKLPLPSLGIRALRLCVLHVAQGLGQAVPAEDPRVQELAQDLRAFSALAGDPMFRSSEAAAEKFFQEMLPAAKRDRDSEAA